MSRRVFSLLLCLFLISSLHASTEYFVSLDGNDQNAGTSEATAFSTVQRGVDALQPGDTLTILPGEYFGSVYRKDLGNSEVQTTIRAKIPGTVLLRGDKDVANFEKVPGMRFVYSLPWPEKPQGMHEIDTLSSFTVLTSISDVEFKPGSYFYDEGQQRLYFSTSDFSAPENHRYSVSMVSDHGFWLDSPSRVIVDGLAATGFCSNSRNRGLPGLNSTWGFMLSFGKDSVLQNLVAYLNAGGISGQSKTMKGDTYTGRGNVITHSTAYANSSPFNIEGGDIAFYFPNADEIRHCSAYLGFPNGIRLYQRPGEFSAIRDSFTRSHLIQGIQNKGAGAHEKTKVERSISLTSLSAFQVQESIIGTSNWYHRTNDVETSLDNIYLSRGRINFDAEFADPSNFDFRLQSTSTFRGSGPNGTDRGPFPYQSDIFYVKPDGDDTADGLSLKTAWKSADAALARLKAGDTLYFEEGTYPIGTVVLKNMGDAQKLTSIRRRGQGKVVLQGSLRLENLRNFSVERLNLEGPLLLDGGENITVTQSQLSGRPVNLQASAVNNLRVTHCQFTGGERAAVELTDSAPPEKAGPDESKEGFSGLFLQSNLFLNPGIPAVRLSDATLVRYSDYNRYAGATPWELAGSGVALEKLPSGLDRYSGVLSSPTNNLASQIAARGAFAMPSGPYPPFERELKISQPVIRSVSATTANIEWFASQPATCQLEWGPTEACENKVLYDVDGYGSYSLTNLEPGTTYYFRITGAQVPEVLAEELAVSPLKNWVPQTLKITTATEDPSPRTYYVAPTGDNSNSGTTVDQAWKTIAHAAQQAEPGDTVLIEPGVYSEQIVIPTTGAKDRPIIFRAKEAGTVYLDGQQRSLTRAFVLRGKSHIYFDGFQSRGFGMPGGGRWPLKLAGVFNLYAGNDIRVTRCFNDGRGGGYSAPLVQAWEIENLLIQNCVAIANAGAIRVRHCPDMVIENNVILRSNIQNLVLANEPDEKILIRNNILGDNQLSKAHVQTFEIRNAQSLVEGNNCYFLRIPDSDRKPFLFGDVEGQRRMSAADFNRQFGQDPSLVVDPQFAGLVRVPADKKAEYGGDSILAVENLSILDFLPTHPEVKERAMGVDPHAFAANPESKTPPAE